MSPSPTPHRQRRRWRLIVAMSVGAVLALAPAAVSVAADDESITLAASRSVTVHQSNPNTAVVGERLLAGGGRETLIAFDVDGVAPDRIVTAATLRLYKVWGPSTTLVLSETAGEWTESTTYTSRPPLGTEVARVAVGATANRWYEFDVLRAVRSAHAAGSDLSLHLTRSAAQNASEFLSTRAADTTLRPQLVLQTRPLGEAMEEEAVALDGLATRPLYQDVELPSSGANGSRISWSSSDPAHLTADGTVTRPEGVDAEVVLTARLEQAGRVLERAVTFTVRALVDVTPQHPQIYTADSDRDAVLAKVADEDWAGEAVEAIAARVDPHIERFATDPTWLTSRMSMYWREGAHCTQVYIAAQNFGSCDGDAPVPTVRYPGMRTWNDNKNPMSLDERLPFSEDGSMRNQNGDIVPYAETGHMVRTNNMDILTVAKDSAFLYWLRGDESYAELAAAVYWQWVLGTYYMNPPLDPTQSLGGPGGYAPGGIGGYYDSEVIHDDLGGLGATIYDFLYDYLQEHPSPALSQHLPGKTVTEVSNEVAKRFIEIGMVRGNRSGNWNTNGWNMIMPSILSLETDDYYADGKGREHYLHYFTTESTAYHEALPDIVDTYDDVTGLWPESPVYAFGTVSQLLDFSVSIGRAGIDAIAATPILEKAALSMLPWLDARGNLVVFGDGRGGSPSYVGLERLHSYYVRNGDDESASRVAGALQGAIDAGNYTRSKAGIVDILDAVPLATPTADAKPDVRAAYSPFHRHLTMRNGSGADGELMATMYGGYPQQHHLNGQGLAVQLYGDGYAVAPQAKSYESYWSSDYVYSTGPAGANTVVPGYTSGEIAINAMEPAVPSDAFTDTGAVSLSQQFSDVSAGADDRRTLGLVKTSPTSGFYVDLFRADRPDSDYLWHAIGDDVTLTAADGTPLRTEPRELSSRAAGYEFFTETEAVAHDGDFTATWDVAPRDGTSGSSTRMWMMGQEGRTLYTADAPPTATSASLTPSGVSTGTDATPSLVVRQDGNDAASSPYVGVFEHYGEGARTVTDVKGLVDDGSAVAIQVSSSGADVPTGHTDTVISATDGNRRDIATGISFAGTYGVVTADDDGLASLYLGAGTEVTGHGATLRSVSGETVAANLAKVASGYRLTARGDVEISVPVPTGTTDVTLRTAAGDVASTFDAEAGIVTATFPPGTYEVAMETSSAPAPTSAPSKARLSSTSGWAHGLHDGQYDVVLDMWWGTPGDRVRLFENGILVEERRLEATGTEQHVRFAVRDRPNGKYVYTAESVNAVGATASEPMTVTVDSAAPGTPVLSHDNWDEDGAFTMVGDLWWGTNATSYRFEIDGTVVGEGTLTAATPGAQQAKVSLTDVPPGSHQVAVVFANAAGETASAQVTIVVRR